MFRVPIHTLRRCIPVFGFLVAGVLTSGQSVQKAAPAETVKPPPRTDGNYILSPNDAIRVNVFEESDLATDATISQDGTITFPLIGVVKLGGLSVNEAAETIRRR